MYLRVNTHVYTCVLHVSCAIAILLSFLISIIIIACLFISREANPSPEMSPRSWVHLLAGEAHNSRVYITRSPSTITQLWYILHIASIRKL